MAAFAGVETPTGRDGDRDRLGRLPQALQAGSGSWDPFAGAALLLAVGWLAFVPAPQEPGHVFAGAWGERGDGRGQLGRPMHLAIHDGELYVPDYFNDRIQVFALDGTPRRVIGQPGDGPGQFDHPFAPAAADDGTVFVTDLHNHRVHKWRPAGR